MKVNFISSEGWKLNGPILIHLKLPKNLGRGSKIKEKRNIIFAYFSILSLPILLIKKTPIPPRESQSKCFSKKYAGFPVFEIPYAKLELKTKTLPSTISNPLDMHNL